jgi:hypothetical protein
MVQRSKIQIKTFKKQMVNNQNIKYKFWLLLCCNLLKKVEKF